MQGRSVNQQIEDLIFSPAEVKAISRQHIDHIRSGVALKGIDTGIRRLDEYLNPIYPGQIGIALARPSNGKTSFMMHMVRRAAMQWSATENPDTLGPIVVSAEMSVEEIAVREISHFIPYNSALLFRGQVEDWDEVDEAINRIYRESPIVYVGHSGYSRDRRPRMSMENISRAVETICDRYGKPPSIVAIDYVQRLSLDRTSKDRRTELSEIVERCKDMALALHTPVILGSQAGRAVESKQPPVPDMEDAKETGNIEETADVIYSLMRPSRYYKIGEIIPKTEDNLICDENLFYIRILKQRMGDAGRGFWVEFDMSISRLADREMDRVYLNED